MTRYKIHTKVARVEPKTVLLRSWKTADGKVETATAPCGWWVRFEGSWESLYLGENRPDLYIGQEVVITIEGASVVPLPAE
jgi:hypothetical protein